MTWTLQSMEDGVTGLVDGRGAVVVTAAGDEGVLRLVRLREKLAARQEADVVVTITFKPSSPLGATDVEMACDDSLGDAAYLRLLHNAAARVHVFADEYAAAQAEELQEVLPL